MKAGRFLHCLLKSSALNIQAFLSSLKRPVCHVRYFTASSSRAKQLYFYGEFRTRKQNTQIRNSKAKWIPEVTQDLVGDERLIQLSATHQRIRKTFRYIFDYLDDPKFIAVFVKAMMAYDRLRSNPGKLAPFDLKSGFSMNWMLATEHESLLFTTKAVRGLQQIEHLDFNLIEEGDERYKVNPRIFMQFLSFIRSMELILASGCVDKKASEELNQLWCILEKPIKEVWWNDMIHFIHISTIRPFIDDSLRDKPDVILQKRIKFYMELLPRCKSLSVEDLVKIILDLDLLRRQHKGLKTFLEYKQYLGLKTEIREVYEPLLLLLERSWSRHSTVIDHLGKPTLWTRHKPYYIELQQTLVLMQKKYQEMGDFTDQDTKLVASTLLFFNWLNLKLSTGELTNLTKYYLRRLIIERFMQPFSNLRGIAAPSSDWSPPRPFLENFQKIFDKSHRLYSILCDALKTRSHTHGYHRMMATYYAEKVDHYKLVLLYNEFNVDTELACNRLDYITTKLVYLQAFARLNDLDMVKQVLYGNQEEMKQDPWAFLAVLPELKFIKTFAILTKFFADRAEWENVHWAHKVIRNDVRLYGCSMDSCTILSNYAAACIELDGNLDTSWGILNEVEEAYLKIKTEQAKENISLIHYTVIVRCCARRWMKEASDIFKRMVDLNLNYRLSALILMKFYHIYGQYEEANALLVNYIQPFMSVDESGPLEKGEFRVYNELIEISVMKDDHERAVQLFEHYRKKAFFELGLVTSSSYHLKWLYGPTLVHMIQSYLKQGDAAKAMMFLDALKLGEQHRLTPSRWRYSTERSYLGVYDETQYPFYSQEKLSRIIKELPPLYQGYYALIHHHSQLNSPSNALEIVQDFIEAKQEDERRRAALESQASSRIPMRFHPILFHPLIELHSKRKEWQHLVRLFDTMSRLGLKPMWVSLEYIFWRLCHNRSRFHAKSIQKQPCPIKFLQMVIKTREDNLASSDSDSLQIQSEKTYLYNALLSFYLRRDSKDGVYQQEIEQVVLLMDKEGLKLSELLETQLKSKTNFDSKVVSETPPFELLPQQVEEKEPRSLTDYIYPN